jgi:hypothetical protein
MIIDQDQDTLGELGIIMNFNDQKVTWNTDNYYYSNKGQRYSTLSSAEALVDIMLI